MIVAKPVVNNQFWILQRDNKKIGNVEACDDGYRVSIDNTTAQYKTIDMIQQREDIKFENILNISVPALSSKFSVHNYPTAAYVHNAVWDVPHRLPLFTKEDCSKSWYAAGWYRVKKGRAWSVQQDPKLIVLQRYKYEGPFYTKVDAQEQK